MYIVTMVQADYNSALKRAYEDGYNSGKNQWQDDYGFTVPNSTIQSLEKAAYAKGLKDKEDINKSVKYQEFKKGYDKAKELYESLHDWDNKEQFEAGLKEGKESNKEDQNLNYRVGYNDGWHDCEASFELGNEFTDSIQEQSYDEGYDQAIDDLIEAGVIGEEEYLDEDYSDECCSDECCSDECYSEYEFGDVVDKEEEYCFSKELHKILNSPFVLDTNYNVNSKESSKGDYKLVGISGLARSGKDVAGKIILENLGEGWARGAFADIPKEMLSVMGVDTKCANKDGEDEYYQYNIRNLMQTLGTDWGRNIDNYIWIKAFKKKNPTGNFVITDVRMENEADFVRDNGGVIIHVKGRGGIKGNHKSEAGIEIKRGDLLVFNDSDLENFEKEVNNICDVLIKSNKWQV